MNESLERRLREMRARVSIRAWNYRQRRHASGVWFRLRRVLADAREAFVVSEGDAKKLVEQGHRPEPVGDELQPPKLIVFAPAERIAAIASARQIPVGLGVEFLEAPCVALVRFGDPDA